ncbi:terminase family protein, partial [bacterium]|nr:terminase family protein [bacterium]
MFARKFLNFNPTPYQERFLRDPSKRIVLRWCRQTGKTTTCGVKILHFAVTRPSVNVIVVAPSLRQSRNLRDKMEPLINSIPRPIRRLIFKKIQRETLRLRNGSTIKFFPNSPDLIRGETADMIVVDEFAMFRDDRYLFNNVLQPMLATRERLGTGYLIVMS